MVTDISGLASVPYRSGNIKTIHQTRTPEQALFGIRYKLPLVGHIDNMPESFSGFEFQRNSGAFILMHSHIGG